MNNNEFNQLYQVQASPNAAPSKAFDSRAQEVQNRFWAMSYAKQNRREVWDGMQRLYYCNDWMWIVNGDDFNQTIRFPTLRDLIMTLTDKYMEDLPEAVIKPYYDEDESLIIAKKAYVDYIQRQPHYKKIRRMAIQDMFFSGDGFMRVNYFDVKQKLKKGEEMESIYRDVGVSYINYRDFFVDDGAVMLHDPTRQAGARDVIIRRMMPYSTFQKVIAPMEGFKTGGVKAEPFIQSMGVDYIVTNSRETMEKSAVSYVKLYEYENIEENSYTVIANGHTIFEGELKKSRGTTSFDVTNYKFEPRNDSFWSNCLGELVAPHIYAKDTIFNLELLNLKLTLQPVMAVSGDFGYNPRVHVLQPGGVWTAGSKLQGKVSDSIEPIIAGNPNTRSYEMLNMISSELTSTSKADTQNLQFSKSQTATQTMAIENNQELHSTTISSINEIEAETVTTKNIIEVMEAFMDADETANARKRKIPIKNYRVREGDGGESVFFAKNGFEDQFYMSDKMINVPCRVEVLDKRSQKAAQIEVVGRIMQFLPMATNILQVDPSMGQRLNLMGIIEQLVDGIGLEHSKTFNDDTSAYEDEYQMLKEELMLGNMVDLPKGRTRKESYACMKFLVTLEKDSGDELTEQQRTAFDHVFTQLVENITRNHLNERYQKEGATGATPEDQMTEQAAPAQAMPGGQLPFQGNTAGMSSPTTSQALGGSLAGGGPKIMPQPDPSVLNPSGRELVS